MSTTPPSIEHTSSTMASEGTPTAITMTEPRTVDERELDELRTMASSADPTQAYKLGKVINTWSAVKIYDAKSLSANGPVRVKVTDLTGVMHSSLVLNEIGTMRAMQEAGSPNIVGLRDVYVSGKNVWLVTEDLAGGSLVDLIERKKKIEESQIAYIAREICQGIHDMHARDIVHCDIKSDNVFFDAQGHVKIVDFGYSMPLASPHTITIGTPYWMAPETIHNKEYTPKADVWAFGIVLMEMIEGEPPLVNEDPVTALKLIVQNGAPALKSPSAVSPELKDFLAQCLAVDLNSRATAAELLQHKFLEHASSPASILPLLK